MAPQYPIQKNNMTYSVRHFGTSHSSWILLLGFRISVPCCFQKCLVLVWPRKGICLYCIILHCNYNKHKWPKFGRYPRPPTSFTESQNVTNTPDPNAKDIKCINQNSKHYNENTKYTKAVLSQDKCCRDFMQFLAFFYGMIYYQYPFCSKAVLLTL